MKKPAKSIILGFIISGMLACTPETAKQIAITDKLTATPDTTPKQSKPQPKLIQHSIMTFVGYNDDGDYYQFIAQQEDSLHYFINNEITDRSLNRGDIVDITWKYETITIAGDNERPERAEMVVSVKKTAEGPVSKFKRTYNKQLKYTWSPDEQYSKEYLDEVYKLAEYYLANTKNELLKNAIAKRDDITYSIESSDRDNRSYTLLGIAPVGENGANVVEWLYIDTENYNLYLFDHAEETLVEFK